MNNVKRIKWDNSEEVFVKHSLYIQNKNILKKKETDENKNAGKRTHVGIS